jgi:dihydroorotate dehydrogenase electron transfer subunit
LFITQAPVVDLIEIQEGIYLQKLESPEIANKILPGQFLNIKVNDSVTPLLRRPFSICDIEGDYLYILFNIYGEGTKILSQKKRGDYVNIMGPLGKGFIFNDEFDLAVFVAGGLGAAPFPLLYKYLNSKKNIISFIGGKSKSEIIKYKFINYSIATEDGSEGFKGNVVELFENEIKNFLEKKIKVFACGPNGMLKALSKSIKNFNQIGYNIICEISTESVMACGFGICQGCPIQDSKNENRFYLVCKDGPIFNINDIIL